MHLVKNTFRHVSTYIVEIQLQIVYLWDMIAAAPSRVRCLETLLSECTGSLW